MVAVRCLSLMWLASVTLAGAPCGADDVTAASPLVHVMLAADDGQPASLFGQILVTAQDGGILLEERSGQLHTLSPEQLHDVQVTQTSYQPFTSDELATSLTAQMGPSFGIRQTEHFVICSAASSAFTDYCSELLEEVHTQFVRFCHTRDLPGRPINRPLPVVIFRQATRLQEYARQQHPETSFENVPGYYSQRTNQMYVCDISDTGSSSRRNLLQTLRRTPRHVETVVHEAVHQLAYNSGLHVRYADNPLWLTEGLALFFEPVSGRGRLLWTGPGLPNQRHLKQLRPAIGSRHLPLSLRKLVQDNQTFLQSATTGDAYATSWAVCWYLLRHEKQAWKTAIADLQQRPRLQEVGVEAELDWFQQAVAMPLPTLERRIVSAVRRK